MPNYHRAHVCGATWFFTVNLLQRKNNFMLIENIQHLRSAFALVKKRHPFKIDAVVILPEHLHCIWTLPENDTDYSTRWRLVKSYFSRKIIADEYRTASRILKKERGIWQRRFWEHMICDEKDLHRHCDYIHWNPVKHGWVEDVSEWLYSSFHYFVAKGWYENHWRCNDKFNFKTGENI